jgi:hypothetical protein
VLLGTVVQVQNLTSVSALKHCVTHKRRNTNVFAKFLTAVTRLFISNQKHSVIAIKTH